MTYVDHNYGNTLEFTDKQSRKTREKLIRDDKNRFVTAAVIYRRRWADLTEFKDYKYDLNGGAWTITVTATPKYHDRLLRLINDPKTLERFFKRQKHWVRRYHRMAKRHAVKREDADAED